MVGLREYETDSDEETPDRGVRRTKLGGRPRGGGGASGKNSGRGNDGGGGGVGSFRQNGVNRVSSSGGTSRGGNCDSRPLPGSVGVIRDSSDDKTATVIALGQFERDPETNQWREASRGFCVLTGRASWNPMPMIQSRVPAVPAPHGNTHKSISHECPKPFELRPGPATYPLPFVALPSCFSTTCGHIGRANSCCSSEAHARQNHRHASSGCHKQCGTVEAHTGII